MAAALTGASSARKGTWCDEVILLAHALVILALVSSQTGFNHHLRYVLPVFPFAYVWASKVAPFAVARGWRVVVPAGLALLWSVVSSLSVYPHNLSYFNELVGGPKGGHAELVDSNIDWGQDLLYLKAWRDEHPEAEPFGLAYFGFMDPRVAGIEFELPPKGPVLKPRAQEVPVGSVGPRPGWYAVSVMLLRGYRYTVPDGHGGNPYLDEPYYTYFLHFQPVAMAGYSIYIYHVTPAEANRVRVELGLPPLPESGD